MSASRAKSNDNPYEDFILALILLIVFFIGLSLLSGCATLYVANKRSEWNEERKDVQIYGEHDTYPAIYRATYITCAVEIPTWWWPWDSNGSVDSYVSSLWVIGAPFSLVDLPVSLISDTFCLPYDSYQWVAKESPRQ